MKRIPIFATLLVAAAIVIMVRLGVWQIHRAHENERQIAQYAAAAKLPPIAFPTSAQQGPLPLFRWASGYCARVVGQRAVEGRNRAGESGWVQIVDCAAGAEGREMAVAVGWSRNPNAKVNWSGGPVSGMIVRDRLHRIRLVAASAPPGLESVGIPSVEDAIQVTPSRNWLYALQWFSFAVIALVIYMLALRKRWKEERPGS